MILDNALAHSVVLPKRTKKILQSLKPQTRRFVFNPDASHKQGRFAMDCIDILCRNAPYLVRPYPNTYIEVDNRSMLEGGYVDVVPDAADRIGYWWTDDGTCFTISGDGKHAEFSPFVYSSVNSPIGHYLHEKYEASEDITEFYGGNFKRGLMIGRVKKELIDEVHKIDHTLLDLFEIGMTNTLPEEATEAFFYESIGTFKYAVAALMLLDGRIKRQLTTVPSTRKIIGGKLRAIAKHEVVTIDLDMPTIRHIYANPHGATGTRDHMIEHDVMEHWAYFNISSQCRHVWVPYYSKEAEKRDKKYGHPETLRRETCNLCGGRRTRKPSFIAGDPNKGSTVGKKQYRVVASREKQK